MILTSRFASITGNIIAPKSPIKGDVSSGASLAMNEKECLKIEALSMLAEIKGLDGVLYKQLYWIATNDITGQFVCYLGGITKYSYLF